MTGREKDSGSAWLFLITFAIIGAILFGCNPAKAHDWYPEDCCSGRDCEPIPIDGVVEEPINGTEGWRVRYKSEKLGQVDVWVPKNHWRVKVNEHDGKYHGCFRTPGGPGLISDPQHAVKSSFVCFWYPVNM